MPLNIAALNRTAAALLGGYAFTWGFTTLATAAQMRLLGVDFGEARTLAYLLAFLVFLAAFLWAFGGRRPARIWLVLAGGGGLMTLAAWGLQLALLA